MIAFASLLLGSAKKAGMKVPPAELVDSESNTYKEEEYIHFATFCMWQMCREMTSWGQHWENAKVIAALTEEECLELDVKTLVSKGFEF